MLLAGVANVAFVASPAASAPRPAPAPVTSSFTVSSFNVLGSSHTPPGGKRASGVARMTGVNQLLEQHDVEVAGFQELQADQYNRFMEMTAGSWAAYPGLQLARKDSENSIGWRTDTFSLVKAETINIPYFNGNPRKMPVVLLREKSTGVLSYFANFHNPASISKYGNATAYRREATRIEIALANKLELTGIPVFFTGDFNEREIFFCELVGGTSLKAARGGSVVDGVCDARRPRSVDWIFGSEAVRFSNYNEDRGDLVDKTTDHPVITSDVQVDAWKFPGSLPGAAAPMPQLTATVKPVIKPAVETNARGAADAVTTTGSELVSTPSTWNKAGADLDYQWLRNGAVIPLANRAKYIVRPADAGKAVTLQVVASLSGYRTGTTTSNGLAMPKLATATTARLADPTIRQRVRPRVTLTVADPDVPRTGRVGVRVDGRWRAGASLTEAADGQITVSVPRLSRGRHTVTAVYYGNDQLSSSVSQAMVLRVRR